MNRFESRPRPIDDAPAPHPEQLLQQEVAHRKALEGSLQTIRDQKSALIESMRLAPREEHDPEWKSLAEQLSQMEQAEAIALESLEASERNQEHLEEAVTAMRAAAVLNLQEGKRKAA